MQKIWCFLFIVILLVGLVSAIDTSSIDQQLGSVDERVQNITGQVETVKTTVTNQGVRDAYLKQKFGEVLARQPGIKQLVEGYKKFAPYTDPVFEYGIGMTPEFSLFFILVIVIWFFLVKYYFTFYSILRDFSTFSDRTSLIISLCTFVILVILRFFQTVSLFFANQVVKLTEFLTSPIMKIIFFVVFVVGVIFLSKFSKEVNVLAGKIREFLRKSRKEDEETALRSRQERVTQTLETYAKAMAGEED